jgi:hypothetical protein
MGYSNWKKMANVHTDSTGTIILSGIMTHPGNFEDKDTGTKIIDQWNTKI